MAPIRKRASMRARTSGAGAKISPATLPLPSDLKNSAQTFDLNDDNAGLDSDDFQAWKLSKKDKRTMKRGLLLQKVKDSGISKERKATTKRRRPTKKLKADIGSLADALPDVIDENVSEDGWEGMSDSGSGAEQEVRAAGSDDGMMQTGSHSSSSATAKNSKSRRRQRTKGTAKLEMKSINHRPGAMKRKRKMEGSEMARFSRNLAQLSGSAAASDSVTAAPSASQKTGTANVGSAGGTGGAAISASDKWAAIRGFIGSTMERDKAFSK